MLKVAVGLGLTFGAAYFAFPAAQTITLAAAPYLLLLICPISMGVMMLMMKRSGESKGDGNACAATNMSHKSPYPQAAGPGKV